MPTEEARSVIVDSLRLLRNASSQISRIWRKRVLKSVNPELQDLTEENVFQGAAPALFSSSFKGKMKERAESLKLISKAAKPHLAPRSFFEGATPLAPREVAAKSAGGGEATGGPRRSPPTSKPSSGRSRQRPIRRSRYAWLQTTEFEKPCHCPKGGTTYRGQWGANRRKIGTFQCELVKGDTGSVDLGHDSRIPVRIPKGTGTDHSSWGNASLFPRAEPHKRGGTETAPERSNHRTDPAGSHKRVLLKPLSGFPKRTVT